MTQALTPPSPPLWQFLGDWLRERNVNQRELAERVGVHETVVGKWLHQDAKRRVRPGSRTIPSLASALGVSVDSLLAMVQADETDIDLRRAAARLATRQAPDGSLDELSDPDWVAIRVVWPRLEASVRRALRGFAEAGARGLIDVHFPTLPAADALLTPSS